MSLRVWFDDHLIGKLTSRNGELFFQYAPTWNGFDLSFAMPKSSEEYQGRKARSFFENILVEGTMRELLAKNNQIDEDDDYSFLKEFGKDCAGALVISNEKLTKKKWSRRRVTLDEINQKIIAKRSLYLDYDDEVNFSLPGVQDKLPIVWEGGELFLAINGYPSTHILKPQVNFFDYKQTVLNEYTCMKMAMKCGLNVPDVELVDYKNQQYFIIKRYDRDGLKRVHQQDFCQALGLLSNNKYEVRGGPSFKHIYDCVKEFSENKTKDLFTVLDWLCFNLIIGNHDTHAKNISFIFTANKWQLAPMYDLMSTAVYKGTTKNFAFAIGGQYNPMQLRPKNFILLEEDLGLRKGTIVKRLKLMMQKIENNMPEQDDFIVHKIREVIKKRIHSFGQKILK